MLSIKKICVPRHCQLDTPGDIKFWYVAQQAFCLADICFAVSYITFSKVAVFGFGASWYAK